MGKLAMLVLVTALVLGFLYREQIATYLEERAHSAGSFGTTSRQVGGAVSHSLDGVGNALRQ